MERYGTVRLESAVGDQINTWYQYQATGKYIKKYIYIYKVPLREEARGVAQERNEKHPA